MAKSKLYLRLELKFWAKPVIFILFFLGLKRMIGLWCFNTIIEAK